MKKTLSIVLSVLFVANLWHVENHNQHSTSGYFFCSENCNNENHFSISHNCQKCLNKNNRLISQTAFQHLIKEYKNSFYSFQDKSHNKDLPIDLFSRPPPDIL
tara:strand:+ start:255 stop:563 length:309 start_codon:yes stop_codon:yes gene_type:complete